MDCYDCHTAGRTATALAVCHHCGAGLCADHARALPDVVRHLSGTGSAAVSAPARRIACTTCAPAEALG
ncbi:DUF2180 family protein [Kitasatospora sp. NPDC059571]|uniref:DUF2180 family protein n=1 Tax=Kitasatospora sp. NPDC059571 TaxID=3346871 RepID=UPI00367364C7